MKTFKVGDRVRIVGPSWVGFGTFIDKQGTIVGGPDVEGDYEVAIIGEIDSHWFPPTSLGLEAVNKFERGDKVRIVGPSWTGRETFIGDEGFIHFGPDGRGDYGVCSGSEHTQVISWFPFGSLEILPEPEKEKPTPAEPTQVEPKIGGRVRITGPSRSLRDINRHLGEVGAVTEGPLQEHYKVTFDDGTFDWYHRRFMDVTPKALTLSLADGAYITIIENGQIVSATKIPVSAQ